jgi:cellulose synthase (UDP-forming)
LLIGPVNMATRLPQLFQRAPIMFEDGQVRVRSTETWQRIFGDFGSNVAGDGLKDAAQVAVSQGSLTTMMSWQSPFDARRVVVALLSATPERLPAVPASFSDPRVNYTIQGDLAIVSNAGYSSFRVGEPFWLGDLPLPLYGMWWLSENPLVLALIFLASAMIIATAAWLFLTWRAKRRVRELGEPE